MTDDVMCAVFWARCLACPSAHALLQATLHGCKPTCELWLQAAFWEQWGEKSVPCVVLDHAPSCSANGTDMFCLTCLLAVPPPSLQQSQLMREPFLERFPSQSWWGLWCFELKLSPSCMDMVAVQSLTLPGSAQHLALRVEGTKSRRWFPKQSLREMQLRELLGSPPGRLSGVHCGPGGRKSLLLPGLDLPKLLKAERQRSSRQQRKD